jgi:hypothetical protein
MSESIRCGLCDCRIKEKTWKEHIESKQHQDNLPKRTPLPPMKYEETQEEKYERWWLNKFLSDGKQIVKVEYCGNKISGSVTVTLSDGSEIGAPQNAFDYQPRKKNFPVFNTKEDALKSNVDSYLACVFKKCFSPKEAQENK